jgi:hypothetical protein
MCSQLHLEPVCFRLNLGGHDFDGIVSFIAFQLDARTWDLTGHAEVGCIAFHTTINIILLVLSYSSKII